MVRPRGRPTFSADSTSVQKESHHGSSHRLVEAEGRTAAENAKLIKQRLEALMGQIPSLKSLEVSYDFLPTCTMPVNVILMTTHDDAEGLKAYAEHPAHVAVGKELIKLVTESRQAIDYTF